MNIAQLAAGRLLDALPEGAYITDCDRRILYWNKAAERITGWSAHEVVGRSCYENILCHIDKDGHPLCGKEYCPLHRSIVTERSGEQPLLIFAQSRSGRRVPVEVTVAPLFDEAGRVVGGVELFRDASDTVSDLRRAKLIQENALRCPLPEDPRLSVAVHRIARDMVGGDYHRLEHIGGPFYAILLADVAGHGVASALYAMQLRALWEDLRPELRDPARTCTAINRRVRAIAPEEGYFATAVYALLDVESGRLSHVRAGHPPPLIHRADGTLDELNDNQPALGMIDDLTYVNHEAILHPGDVLLLYTDGAIEVADLNGEELGVSGLREMLQRTPPNALPDLGAMEEELLAHSGCIHLPDDITLLTVRRP
ncbi:MAG TPA: SpoIIE family protein phosphatase [Kiritimatiellia bacterium]|nr:SpoIIE family protein phosphatase [Kiritimatiellia bacterium]